MSQDCFVLDGVVWKRLGANLQHRSVLLVPQHLIPEILHEAHGHLLAGHFGVTKTKQRLLQSYYWPNMERDITEHLRHCDKCQLTKNFCRLYHNARSQINVFMLTYLAL